MENYFNETKEKNQVVMLQLAEEAETNGSNQVNVMIKAYDVLKSVSENTYTLKGYKVAELKEMAVFLNIDQSLLKQKKNELVTIIVNKIAALLLEPCRICKHYYNVGRCEIPLLTCFFCGQGCHNDCYKDLVEGSTHAPGTFYTCISCEISRGTKSKLYSGMYSVEDDISEEVSPSSQVTHTHHDGNQGPIPPKKKVCKFFLRGKCKHGSDGKSNGGCKFRHPQVCDDYANYGKFHVHGCDRQNCDAWHPKICYEGVNTGTCNKRRCPYFHGDLIKRDFNSSKRTTSRRSPTSYETEASGHTSSSPNLDNFAHSFLETVRHEMSIWKDQILTRLVPSQPLPQMVSSPHPHLLHQAPPFQNHSQREMFLQEQMNNSSFHPVSSQVMG